MTHQDLENFIRKKLTEKRPDIPKSEVDQLVQQIKSMPFLRSEDSIRAFIDAVGN